MKGFPHLRTEREIVGVIDCGRWMPRNNEGFSTPQNRERNCGGDGGCER